MIDKIAASITEMLLTNGIVDAEDCEIYEYGMNLIISGVMGGFVIIVLSLLIGRFELGVMFLGVIIPVRMYTGGYHANTHLMCNVVFSIVYLVSIVMYEWLIQFSLENVIWIVTIISAVMIAVVSPLENSNKPITKEEKKKYKRISICLCIMVMLIVKIVEKQYHMILYMNVVLIMVAVLLILGVYKEKGLHN